MDGAPQRRRDPISWASAEDDFDLHVFDADGNRVASSIAANTTSERVLIEKASGEYSVRVNPFAVTDSDYEGEVELHSRKRTPRDTGVPGEPVFDQPCAGGRAGGFPCKGVDLAAFLPHGAIGGGEGNDIWGWTDPDTGREYALVGKTIGTGVRRRDGARGARVPRAPAVAPARGDALLDLA